MIVFAKITAFVCVFGLGAIVGHGISIFQSFD